MKNSKIRRIGSFLLALVIAVSSYVGVSIPVFADSWPNPTASAEPTFAGYRVKDVANWSPKTDPYAELMRAQVPLQDRNAAFAATQANPELASDAQVMLMQGDYGNSFFGSTMYTNEFSEHVLNYWQYTDYYSPWHGAATAYTPDSLYDPVTSDWRARGFEFGIVNIPNPAYTNAAHKNGVLSIACIYFDPAFRPGQTCADMVEKDEDGNFPVADQLIAMAEYYGYDGYFLNQEEGNYEDFKPFMAYLTAHGLYTQWYDTNSSFNASKSAWLKDDTYGQIHNSVFVNYGWNNYTVDSAVSHAASIGVDPFKTVFFGAECNQNGFSGGHSSARNITNLYDEDGNSRASVALFTPSDFYQRGLEGLDTSADGDPRPTMQKDGYQWMVAERERMFFSGVYEDPTDTGIKAAHSREDVYVSNAGGWVGVADFISERSVINGSAFYTNFNTGHGMQYFKNGKVSKDEEWTNINIQEILPTWQWWVDSEDATKLEADFDYGAELVNLTTEGEVKTMPYTQIGAYDGGSSLVVYGDITGQDVLHLYKTDLDVNDTTTASVTFKKTSEDGVSMLLGVIFEDAPDAIETFDLENSAVKGDWTTAEADLSMHSGRQIAALCLVFETDAAVQDYQINIGNITVTDQSYKPSAPTGLTVDYAYADGQMIVSWDKADYSEVIQYNLYGVNETGGRVYLGGIYGDILYVKNTFAEDFVTLQLCAVGIDGSESAPATLMYRYDDKVSNVTVLEAESESGLVTGAANAGEITVSFDAPATGAPDSYAFEVALRNIASDDPDNKTYTGTAAGTATSAVIAVPVDERYEYDLKIYAVNGGDKGEPICYRGYTNDNYSEPIAEDDIVLNGSTVRLVDPDSVDWYKMTLSMNGTQVKSFTRGSSSGNKMTATLPTTSGVLSVVVQDYAGNLSEATVLTLQNGVVVNPDDLLTEADIPDAALRSAIMAQAGATRADAEAYTGTLDLTGTAVKDLTGIGILKNTTVINFTNCDSLTAIAGLEGCAKLNEVIVSGCDKLEKLDLSGLGLEKLTGEGPFAKLIAVDISDNRLDLSEGTPERSFLDVVTAAVEANRNAPVDPEPDPEPTPGGGFTLGENLLPGGTVLSSSYFANVSLFVDGDTATDTYATPRTADPVVVIDLGEEKNIGGFAIYGKMNSDTTPRAFGIKSARIEVSDSPDTGFVEAAIATIEAGTTAGELLEAKVTFEEMATGRYVRITVYDFFLQANGDRDWPQMQEAMAFEAIPAETAVTYTEGENLVPNATVVSSSNISAVSTFVDGDTTTSTYAPDRDAEANVVLDLGAEKKIYALSVWTQMNVDDPPRAFGIKTAKFAVTNEVNGTWTELGTATIAAGTAAGELIEGKLTLEEAASARYVRVTVTEWWPHPDGGIDWPAMYETMVYEAVAANAQSEPAPAAALADEPAGQSEDGKLDAQLIAYNGNKLNDTAAGPEKVFDGKLTDQDNDKWCEDGYDKWIAFDIGSGYEASSIKLYHAGANNEWTPSPGAINTDSYELYVLDETKVDVDKLLAKSFVERTAQLMDSTNWIEVAKVSGNRADITTHELTGGRIFKLNISKTDSTGWGACVRLYEVEVYGSAVEPVRFDNQRPVPYPAFGAIDGTTIEKEVQDSTLDMTGLIEEAVTIRGSAYATLDEQRINGVKFIADDLDLTVVPNANADITITDQNYNPVEGHIIDLYGAV